MSPVATGVPWTLVRLKLRLLRNQARAGSNARAQLVVSTLLALGVGIIGAIVVAGAGRSDDAHVTRGVIVIGASALTFGWTLLPLVSFGSDESLDPGRLVLLPLRRRPLMRGLLLASLVGPAPLAVLLVVAGALIGYLGVSWVALPALVLLVLLAVATARTVSTALAASLTSRRARDTTIVLVSVGFLALQGLRFVNLTFTPEQLDRVSDVLQWLPPGMLGQAVIDAGAGRTVRALAELVPALVLLPLLLAAWGRFLDRSLTTVASEGARGTRRTEGEDAEQLPLLPRALPFLRRSPWGAVAAKELRYLLREPRHKVGLMNTILLGAGLPVLLALRSGDGLHERSVLLASIVGYVVILAADNQFGVDGAAIWLDMVAGDTLRSVVVGKNAAVVAQAMPVGIIVGVGVAVLTGGWAYLPGSLVLAVAGLGAGLATANVVSVRYPIPLPETGNPFGGAGGGQGCARSAVLMVCILVQGLLLLPVGVAALVGAAAGPGWLLVAAPLAAGYGYVLWRNGVRIAVDHARAHGPELLVAVDPSRTSA